jgi:hypothetical protein
MTNPAGQKNCNQTVLKAIFLLLDRKKENSAFKTNPARSAINATFANTDNKVNKLVTVFASCSCFLDNESVVV